MTLAWNEWKLVAVTILSYPAGSSRMLGSLPHSIVTKLESGERSSESVLINNILRWSVVPCSPLYEISSVVLQTYH